MNINRLKIYSVLLSIALLLASGCSGILEEEPRALLTPNLFETDQGLEGGVVAAYAYLRYYYGPEGPHNLTVYGTDEFTNGNQVSNPPLNNYQNLDANNGDVLTPWNRAYPAINTCNGVIQFGTSDDMTEDRRILVAEAKYLRAHWYFILVRTFGGVTLDLGSGPLAFNTSPVNNFSRASVAETYEAIINDLEDAAADLPDRPSAPGRAWKATAWHTLAKAYLARAYSEAAQPGDYQKALEAAEHLINNKGAYGVALLDDFADVHREGNDDNAEILFSVQRNGDPNFTDISGFGAPNEVALQMNRANYFFRCFYERASDALLRDVGNGRPWIRFKPTDWLLNEAFNNKTVDSRYDKSFQTVWYANNPDLSVYPTWSAGDVAAGYVPASMEGQPKFTLGDTCVWMPPNYINLTSDDIARLGYIVYTPEYISTQKQFFPSLSKFNATDRPQPGTEDDANVSSYRPYPVYRFSETYLVAAEAAFQMGNAQLAADYINVVRKRAAWPGKESEMEVSASDVDIDFILDERSRELAGECMRWFDLARTKKLVERVKLHNQDGAPNIQPFHVLRPIPQGYIDLAIDPASPDGKYPQNPGY
ncbi:MAG: RagB/SusD family nutrient uptake outer membrane protein [Phaeodactylibacter sp.]|nr:RagB/SusD family nutrient uptake outer membrane protein [Phaeodactylibacter sp.]MCB9274129.1 RagB/SusD family nutrient uptake outer membrane protein [Lewinellaceae bacterium]